MTLLNLRSSQRSAFLQNLAIWTVTRPFVMVFMQQRRGTNPLSWDSIIGYWQSHVVALMIYKLQICRFVINFTLNVPPLCLLLFYLSVHVIHVTSLKNLRSTKLVNTEREKSSRVCVCLSVEAMCLALGSDK